MPLEIERKFLVVSDAWRPLAGAGQHICQGYLSRSSRGKIRVRRAAGAAFLTVKGPRNGISRTEFEYPIPVADAEEMLRDLCVGPLLEKTRYEVPHAGKVWEIDAFMGVAEGLVLAEVELAHAHQRLTLPRWVGREVTNDLAYRSSEIVRAPPRRWSQSGFSSAGDGLAN